jgi:hypothetical protein
MPTNAESRVLFGPLVSSWDVESAVLATLRTWLPTYLAEVERQHNLKAGSLERPPTHESYHGGTTEAISWDQGHLPEVIVVVEPDGEPERSASVGVIQAYAVQVWCVVMGDDGTELADPEDAARQQAAHYGAAVQLLEQKGTIAQVAGEQIQWTLLSGAPRVECPEPDIRNQQASVTTFKVWVAPIFAQRAGPTGPTPQESPGYESQEDPFAEAPDAKDGAVTVKAEPTGTPL